MDDDPNGVVHEIEAYQEDEPFNPKFEAFPSLDMFDEISWKRKDVEPMCMMQQSKLGSGKSSTSKASKHVFIAPCILSREHGKGFKPPLSSGASLRSAYNGTPNVITRDINTPVANNATEASNTPIANNTSATLVAPPNDIPLP
uniref:Uncharacterized protein n=1 Tax=Nelumbo nucifera TaxID=4432 RepID=A0A822Z101_NELNU|nr:TPA_asm: hypothetical protein HUJ06_007786 [Nelumbo nucifera]